MDLEVRTFQRPDRDQVTALVNAHIGAVLPGLSVSANAVLSQLEREPAEFIVDPWIAERVTLVAVERERVVAAAHLRRYGDGEDVGDSYRDAGEIAWLLFWPDAPFWPDRGAASILADRCIDQLREWGVGRIYADGALPAPAIYGVPDAWPHVRRIYESHGFVQEGHTEIILVADVDDLPSTVPSVETNLTLTRTLGINGVRLTASSGGDEVGFVELDTDLTRGAALSRYAGWADIGNLEVDEGFRSDGVAAWLLGQARDWLRLARADRLLAYSAIDEGGFRAFLMASGFREVTTTARGWTLVSGRGDGPLS
jgi:GNAT superfamily N-acetyltransferase